MGAAASLKSLVITPCGDESVVLATVTISVVVLKVVRNGKVGAVTVFLLLFSVVVVVELRVVVVTFSVDVDIDAVLGTSLIVFSII